MPRLPRVVVPGVPHHVTQRGHRREEVFFRDADREHYLGLLARYAPAHGLAIQAWCLMGNHLHLVAVPERAESLARALKPVHLCYAQYVGRVYGTGGHIWQGRFYSCPLDEAHTWAAIRYVERNPVRAGLAAAAEEYPWSSAAAHCGRRADPVAQGVAERAAVMGDWSAWLRGEECEDDMARLRLRTRTGRPVGAQEFVAGLEERFGRRLEPSQGGRPRKG